LIGGASKDQAHGELETVGNSLGAGYGKLSVQTGHARADAVVEILQLIQQSGGYAAEAGA
jgi:hypothetical protein